MGFKRSRKEEDSEVLSVCGESSDRDINLDSLDILGCLVTWLLHITHHLFVDYFIISIPFCFTLPCAALCL